MGSLSKALLSLYAKEEVKGLGDDNDRSALVPEHPSHDDRYCMITEK